MGNTGHPAKSITNGKPEVNVKHNVKSFYDSGGGPEARAPRLNAVHARAPMPALPVHAFWVLQLRMRVFRLQPAPPLLDFFLKPLQQFAVLRLQEVASLAHRL